MTKISISATLPKEPPKPRKPKQLAFDYGDLNPAQQSFVKAAHKSRKAIKESWKGMLAVPPNSLFERVLDEFKRNTNIALEIPFTTLMHYVSGYLCSKDVVLDVHGQSIKMDFWTIVLAESGGGKTWTQSQIGRVLSGAVPEFQGSVASAAKFIDELAVAPKGLWVRDEFLQFLRSIEQPGSPMAETKDYLLRIYDNAEIVRKTKQYDVSIPSPALSILAFNALKPFTDGVAPETLLDGFAQRFAYVVARKDPHRKFEDYAIWSVNSDPWRSEWNDLVRNILPKYESTAGAEKAFIRTFATFVKHELDESFYRRILWRAHKYALVYHIIRGKAADKFVDEEDYGWAARLITLQLADASEVLEMCAGSDIGKLIEQCETVADKLIAAKQPVTPRVLMQRVRGLTSASMARFVFDMMDAKYLI